MRTCRCPCCGCDIREDQLEEVNSSGCVPAKVPKGITTSSVIEGAECVHIADIRPRHWGLILFLLLWLSLWATGLAFILVHKFLHGVQIKPEALILILFFLMGVFVGCNLLHLLFGGRRVEVGRTTVKSTFCIIGTLGRTKVFPRGSGDTFCVQRSEVHSNGRPAWDLVLESRFCDYKILWTFDHKTAEYLAAYFNRV